MSIHTPVLNKEMVKRKSSDPHPAGGTLKKKRPIPSDPPDQPYCSKRCEPKSPDESNATFSESPAAVTESPTKDSIESPNAGADSPAILVASPGEYAAQPSQSQTHKSASATKRVASPKFRSKKKSKKNRKVRIIMINVIING